MSAPSLYIRKVGYALIAALAAQVISVKAFAAEQSNRYIVLCYHSVPERYHGDPMSISAPRFVEHLVWMREQGYIAVTLDQILQAKSGKLTLPDKSFLVTIDDGYEDIYTTIFPILKLYKVPAVIGLVGKWIEDGRPSKNETDPHFVKQRFLSWAQIREMTKSGLVEVASHSYDLHHGILGNPQGNMQPAAVTLQFKSPLNRYETADQRRARIRADLERNTQLIQRHLGIRPRAMVWPYGAYDRIAIEEAARVGMPINFTLDPELASAANSGIVPRFLIDKDMPLSRFSYLIPYAYRQHNTGSIRAITIHLDNIFDEDLEKQNQKLGVLIEHVRALGLNTVVLQPFAIPQGAGLIEAAYFPNSSLAMRADLLNRVAWQLRSRLGVAIYTLAPVSQLSVTERGKPRRLDPSIAQDLKSILKIYEDLSHYSHIQGIIFTEEHVSTVDIDVQESLLSHIRHHRSIQQPLSVKNATLPQRSRQGWSFQTAYQSHPFEVIDVPRDLRATDVREFMQELPRSSATWFSLDTKDLDENRLHSLVQRIKILKDNGAKSFLLDDDRFLDAPEKISVLRSALSLKSNPYLEVGQ